MSPMSWTLACTTTAGGAIAHVKFAKTYELLQTVGMSRPETLRWINSAEEL